MVHLLSARKTRAYANKTEQLVECGMDPIGDAWIRYSAVYYLYALIFVAFAVDVLFLIPVALVYNRVLSDPRFCRAADLRGDSVAGDCLPVEERIIRMEPQAELPKAQ